MSSLTTNGQAAAERVAFTTSRLSEYSTVKELTAQIGFPPELWPAAILKEAADNGLDAAEASGASPPAVSIDYGDDYLSVTDNGPGIPEAIVAAALDFATKTSTNAKYVSPTRGQQGNALKCLFAAPTVLSPGQGKGVTIEAKGLRHRVTLEVNGLTGEPRVRHEREEAFVQNGTRVTVDVACSSDDGEGDELYKTAASFALLNPHAVVTINGLTFRRPPGGAPSKRWDKSKPTSAHWYSVKQFVDLVGAYVHAEREGGAKGLSLREFVAAFDGLKQTAKAKAVLESCGMSRMRLADLVGGDRVDEDKAELLLSAMQDHAKPVKPKALGVIGKGQLALGMAALFGVDPRQDIDYSRKAGFTHEGHPFVVEVAVGRLEDDDARRVVVAGLNSSPLLVTPDWLERWLGEAMVDPEDPVMVVFHITTPVVGFTDRGKSRIVLPPGTSRAARDAVRLTTKDHTAIKKRMSREERKLDREARERHGRPRGSEASIKESAWAVMVAAHAHVVEGGSDSDPAQARQIMYAARRLVLASGGRCWKKSKQFTQGYLPEFLKAHPELVAEWDVVFDARGSLQEPHGGKNVVLGTVGVRSYIASWAADDPRKRFSTVLLLEKEGFHDLLRNAEIADTYDVAIMTTKGLSTVAARRLIQEFSRVGIRTLVLHDFDKSGLLIWHTIRSNTSRWRYSVEPLVTDLGIRLTDAQDLGLEGETVEYKVKKDPRIQMAEMGVSEEERNFLVGRQAGHKLWVGKRVELNELANQQLLDLIRRKLAEAGVKKVVPDEATLRLLFTGHTRDIYVEREVARAKEEAERRAAKLGVAPPADLARLVASRIDGKPVSWRASLMQLAAEQARQAVGG